MLSFHSNKMVTKIITAHPCQEKYNKNKNNQMVYFLSLPSWYFLIDLSLFKWFWTLKALGKLATIWESGFQECLDKKKSFYSEMKGKNSPLLWNTKRPQYCFCNHSDLLHFLLHAYLKGTLSEVLQNDRLTLNNYHEQYEQNSFTEEYYYNK